MKRVLAAALVACGLGAAPSGAGAADAWIGSPVIRLNDTAKPKSVVCFFSNVGDRKLKISDQSIFERDGTRAKITAKTCGSTSGFKLAPGEICSITTTKTSSTDYGCKARASDPKLVRGSVELRNGSPTTLASAPLTAGPKGTPADEFRTLASPPMFGALNQAYAICNFTNLGTQAARLTGYELKSSTGEVIPSFVSYCGAGAGGEVQIDPGQTCGLSGFIEAKDLRCKGSVTRSSDIRASVLIAGGENVTLNWRPLR